MYSKKLFSCEHVEVIESVQANLVQEIRSRKLKKSKPCIQQVAYL